MKEIKNILALPPTENETRRQTMQVLQVILILFSFISLTYSILSCITDFPNWGRYVAQGGFLLFCMLLGLVYLRKGYVRLVATLEILVIWLIFTISAYTGGGVRSSGYFGYLVVLVIAGVVSGKRLDTMIVVFLCAGVGYYLVYAESNGTLPPSRVPMTPFALWLDSLIYFFVVSILLFLTMSIVQNALQRLNRELSERRHAEEMQQKLIGELEERNAELEQFAYAVSHDLRNPIITIKGFVGMLEKDIRENRPDRTQADINRISSAADKMGSLLRDLLSLSRVGRVINPPEEIDLVQLTKEALEMLDERIRTGNIAIKISPSLPVIYADHVRMREVMENLISNAAKYMGSQPHPLIEIDGENRGAETVIYVKDNGIGIEPQFHAKIFGLFEKLNPDIEGTGVGLAIVKRIIEKHGGRIWVESEGPGKGSTFCFTIPNKADDQS